MIRVFINGFGRIGRSAARILLNDNRFELIGINDIYSFEQMRSLYEFDSIYGHSDNMKAFDRVKLYNQKDPSKLDLKNLDIDILLQCSGVFLSSKQNQVYIDQGVKKVIISAPAADTTPTYIYGVTHQNYKGEKIISNSSCSANAIVPIFDIIHKEYSITSACMSMLHSYTAYQKLLDVKHYSKDIRRTRSATQNIIPLQSSATVETAKFFPHLLDKLYAKSIRIPVSANTLFDLTITTEKKISREDLITLFKNKRSSILDISDKNLVSHDLIQNQYSATIDLELVDVIGGDLLRVSAWQDNEYGYAKRLIDMAGVIV
jgi:glyceraldehyde 3-phosphate dehydrogenase